MNIKKYIRIVLSTTAIVLVVYFGVFLAKTFFGFGNGPSDPNMDSFRGGRMNFLLLGTDESGLRTDTIVFASVDSSSKKINVLSIPRDTRVVINGKYQKINAAFALGKKDSRWEATIKEVKELLGLPIHYYIVVHPKGFREVIDVLGGVYLDVPQRMKYSDPVQNLYIDLQPGYQLLNGNKAEQFCRFRSYTTGDIGRIHAQQAFIKALTEQKLKPEYILKSVDLFNAISSNMKTNIKAANIPRIAAMLTMLKSENLHSYQLPGADEYINGVSYYIHHPKATNALVNESFLNNTPPSSPPPKQ